MGGMLSSVLDTDSHYQASPAQAGNPYAPQQLQYLANNQGQIYGQQQALAQQLQQQMAGQGPNPAQLQYQQNVNQNIAQAQGLISSQRGLNPALAAKMGANAASQANQQAAGQSGIMQAQQQLAAGQNLGNLYGQLQQGNVGYQQNYTGANQGAMQTNAAVANANQQQAGNLVGGALNGISGALGMAKAHGGMIENYAGGGFVNSSGPQSSAGQYLSGGFGALGAMGGSPALATWASGMGSKPGGGGGMPMSQGDMMAGGPMDAGGGAAGAGGIEGLTESAGPLLLMANQGGAVNFQPGGYVPGKATVNGDSPQNDTVPAVVSPGEVVLPRSVVNSKDPQKEAAKFLGAVLAKRKK